MKKLSLSRKIAYLLRVLAIPPVMATALLLLVWFNGQAIASVGELVASFVFLVIIPAAAYPVSLAIPGLRKGGRETQRSLAFRFAGLGYAAAVMYGVVCHKSQGLNFIYLSYLFSVLLLAVVNHFSRTKASGHACSVISPAVIVCYYYKLFGAVIGAAVYAAVLWSSLVSKRHTVGEFLLGTVLCIAAVGLSALLVFVWRLPV